LNVAIVQKQHPPKMGAIAISRALGDLRALPSSKMALGGAHLNLSQPLPLYRLGLDELIQPDALSRAVHVGWRYLMEGMAGGGAGYADVKDIGGGSAKFSSLSRNRNADRLMEAAHLAQDVAKSLPNDCEARILDVPTLYTSAIWLTGPLPVFIPYISPKLVREEGPVRVEPTFLEELLQLAKRARRHLPIRDRA
jgi:hypothetical protein